MRLRRSTVPDAVKALKTNERRLAWGLTLDGTVLVATATGLHAGASVLAWTQVEKVLWQPPLLTLVETAEVEGSGLRHTWELTEDARLAETVRAGVTSSIGWSDRRALAPEGAVRLVGRRVPGFELLQWQLVFEAGTDPHDPLLRAQAEAMVLDLRRTLG